MHGIFFYQASTVERLVEAIVEVWGASWDVIIMNRNYHGDRRRSKFGLKEDTETCARLNNYIYQIMHYFCYTLNQTESSSLLFSLRVLEEPRISLKPKNRVVKKTGESVILQCIATGKPKPQVGMTLLCNSVFCTILP